MHFLLAQVTPDAAGTTPAEAGSTPDITQEAQDLWSMVLEFLTTRGVALAINIVAALAIFVVGRWVARILLRVIQRIMVRAKVEDTLSKFIGNIAYAMMLAFVILAAINRLGVDTTSFAAIIAAAGLAIGFALQGSLANFAAGVMLIVFKPFKAGDFIEAGGCKGVVEEVHIFNTRMRTGDNVLIIIPNSQVTNGVITNFSAKDTRRIDLVFGCGYNDDLAAVKQYLEQVLTEDERILKDPEPVIAVGELGASSVDLIVRPWVKSSDYWAVRWDLTEKIKVGFDTQGFNIPYPQQDVHMHQVAAS